LNCICEHQLRTLCINSPPVNGNTTSSVLSFPLNRADDKIGVFFIVSDFYVLKYSNKIGNI
jgi:hypothetical protein